jgi:integrase
MAKAKYKPRADGRYQTKIYLGNGKYKYLYADTPKELEKIVVDVKIQLRKGVDVTAERDTFMDWANHYLKQRKLAHARGDLTTSRLNISKNRINDLAPIHNMQITKIRTRDVQDIIDDKTMEGVSVSVLKDIKSAAKNVFQLALDNQVITFNPAESVKVATEKHKKPVRRALTQEEQSWIEAPTENRCQCAAMIMMHAGLRRGELIPLTWADIDLEKKCIDISKAVEFKSNQPIVKTYGKTDASTRIVYIPQKLANYLAERKKAATSMIVCPDTKGNMLSVTAYRRMWDSYMSELNFKFGDFSNIINFKKPKSRFAPVKIPTVIPEFTAHWLRHTFITNMYFAGVDVLTAKEQAGHADIKTTMEIYTHLDKIYKKKQMNKMDEYFRLRDSLPKEEAN